MKIIFSAAVVLWACSLGASAQLDPKSKGIATPAGSVNPAMSLAEGSRICAEALVDLCNWPGSCDINAAGSGKTPKALGVWVDKGHDAVLTQPGNADDSRGHVEVARTTHGFSVFFTEMRSAAAGAAAVQHKQPGMFFCRYEDPGDTRPNLKLNMTVDIGFGKKPLSLYRLARHAPLWTASPAPKDPEKDFIEISCRRPASADADDVLENADLFLSKFVFKGELAAPAALQEKLCDGLSRCEAGLGSGSAPKAHLKNVSDARARYGCKGPPSFGPGPTPLLLEP